MDQSFHSCDMPALVPSNSHLCRSGDFLGLPRASLMRSRQVEDEEQEHDLPPLVRAHTLRRRGGAHLEGELIENLAQRMLRTGTVSRTKLQLPPGEPLATLGDKECGRKSDVEIPITAINPSPGHTKTWLHHSAGSAGQHQALSTAGPHSVTSPSSDTVPALDLQRILLGLGAHPQEASADNCVGAPSCPVSTLEEHFSSRKLTLSSGNLDEAEEFAWQRQGNVLRRSTSSLQHRLELLAAGSALPEPLFNTDIEQGNGQGLNDLSEGANCWWGKESSIQGPVREVYLPSASCCPTQAHNAASAVLCPLAEELPIQAWQGAKRTNRRKGQSREEDPKCAPPFSGGECGSRVGSRKDQGLCLVEGRRLSRLQPDFRPKYKRLQRIRMSRAPCTPWPPTDSLNAEESQAVKPELLVLQPSRHVSLKPHEDIAKCFVLDEHRFAVGQFGALFRCTRISTGGRFACKVIEKKKLKTKESLKDVCSEVVCLEALWGTPSIIDLVAAFEDEEKVHIVMELCEGGDLLEYVESHGCLEDNEAATVCRSLALALHACHSRGIVHRDVKPENVFLAKRNTVEDLKLGDFGVATLFTAGKPITDFAGTPDFMAPEVFQGSYGPEVDTWGLGALLHFAICGCPPNWDSLNPGPHNAQHLAFDSPAWLRVSEDCKNVISGMLQVDPGNRIILKDVLKHPWICKQHIA